MASVLALDSGPADPSGEKGRWSPPSRPRQRRPQRLLSSRNSSSQADRPSRKRPTRGVRPYGRILAAIRTGVCPAHRELPPVSCLLCPLVQEPRVSTSPPPRYMGDPSNTHTAPASLTWRWPALPET